MLSVVMDPPTLANALRSAAGASNALLREVSYRRLAMLLTAPLIAEYRQALMDPEQRLAHGRMEEAIDRLVAAIAAAGQRIDTSFQWRPWLTDPADELVVQAAALGEADAIVTLRPKRFAAAQAKGLTVLTPTLLLRRLR